MTKERDEIYCGEGKDHYIADELDYVDSSCEVGVRQAEAAHCLGGRQRIDSSPLWGEGLPERGPNTSERHHRHRTGSIRTSENLLHPKFAEFTFHALG